MAAAINPTLVFRSTEPRRKNPRTTQTHETLMIESRLGLSLINTSNRNWKGH